MPLYEAKGDRIENKKQSKETNKKKTPPDSKEIKNPVFEVSRCISCYEVFASRDEEGWRIHGHREVMVVNMSVFFIFQIILCVYCTTNSYEGKLRLFFPATKHS